MAGRNRIRRATLARTRTRNTRGTFGLRASIFRAASEYEMGTIVEVLDFYDFQRARVDDEQAVATCRRIRSHRRTARRMGKRLPIQETFALGGDDGFAGYRIGELRGIAGSVREPSRAERANLAACARRVRCPAKLRMVTARYVRDAGPRSGELFGGVRAGLEAATPVGPIRVEEGVANTGQRAILIRVGRWF